MKRIALVLLAAAVVVVAYSCGEAEPPVNTPPRVAGSIPAQEVMALDTVKVDLSQYFADDDGDQLSYAATSGNLTVLGVSVSGSIMTIRGRRRGEGTIKAIARDPDGLAATQQVDVTVRGTPGFLTVEIRYDGDDIGAAVLLLEGPPADSIQAAEGLTLYHAPGEGGVRTFVAGTIPTGGPLFRFWTEDASTTREYRGILEQVAGTDYRQQPVEAASVTVVK